jgi:hypothetical protein
MFMPAGVQQIVCPLVDVGGAVFFVDVDAGEQVLDVS